MICPEWLKKKTIGVLYGGFSEEKEISRSTGKTVLHALRESKLKALGIEVDHSLPQNLRKHKIGYCFIALHGRYGEDGTVQGLCETMGLPYSGSGVLASALSMNKAFSKILFQKEGIPTPSFEVLDRGQDGSSLRNKTLPLVIKPVDGGSAIGVTIARNRQDLEKALKTAFRYSSQALVEKYIPGREVTVPILGDRVLPLIEIVPKGKFYDFRSKYVKGMSNHILPARLSGKSRENLRNLAWTAHKTLGCRGFSRVDFIVDEREKPWILELNSIPGMTKTSLFPESAKAGGVPFPEMLIEIMKSSGRR